MSFGQRNYDRSRPEIEFPGETPPEDLVIEDLIEGSGPAVKAGDNVECHYVGVAWSTGAEFDASWNRGQPLPFTVGVGQVIKGWDERLVGRTVGSRVILEIPPADGYGKTGNEQAGIKGTDTLFFVVDILKAS